MNRSAGLTGQQSLARSNKDEQFRAIAELHGDIAWTVDCASGLLTYVSPAAIALSGYGLEQFHSHVEVDWIGGPLADLGAGLAERLRRFAAGDLSRKRLVRSFEQALADGRVIPLEVTSSIVVDAAGEAVAVVGTARDVSELRHELREKAAEQRRFTSMLNHEFRTPLSTIDGAIQRLEVTGANADEPTRLRYRKIQAAVDRLIGLLDEHLSPERMDEASATRPAESVSPALLLEEAAQMVRAAGRQAILQIGDLPAQLRCQPGGLRVAMKVMVDNALQYGPAGLPITVSGQRAEGGVELLVRDGGAGIPAADLPRIFDKRYRGSKATGFGSGLGLYMARSVVEVCGGHISARNVAPSGAEFRIWLPARAIPGKSVAQKVINSDNSDE
ncbi:ATP-binding protein [Massilia sp. TSP1-1-2]|uniref:PAS domain-containing sensor histidine kinase n=1 Tax=unclassified Massilia TaxID=2609279 RepID=UPI003CEC7BB6